MEHIDTHRLMQILPVATNLAVVEVYVKRIVVGTKATAKCLVSEHSVNLRNNSNKTIIFCCELKQNLFIISNIN